MGGSSFAPAGMERRATGIACRGHGLGRWTYGTSVRGARNRTRNHRFVDACDTDADRCGRSRSNPGPVLAERGSPLLVVRDRDRGAGCPRAEGGPRVSRDGLARDLGVPKGQLLLLEDGAAPDDAMVRRTRRRGGVR